MPDDFDFSKPIPEKRKAKKSSGGKLILLLAGVGVVLAACMIAGGIGAALLATKATAKSDGTQEGREAEPAKEATQPNGTAKNDSSPKTKEKPVADGVAAKIAEEKRLPAATAERLRKEDEAKRLEADRKWADEVAREYGEALRLS